MKTISITWSTDDVHYSANDQLEIAVSEQFAEKVLEALEHYYDANIGINWEVIGITINNLKRERSDWRELTEDELNDFDMSPYRLEEQRS